jgi:hypothetical protein
MKRRPIALIGASYALVSAAILFALPALSAQPSNVTIQYVSPEKFTDFRIYGRDAQWSASYFVSQISDYLSPVLNRRFPNAKLTLRFTGKVIEETRAHQGNPDERELVPTGVVRPGSCRTKVQYPGEN